jgi:hypothetical protein
LTSVNFLENVEKYMKLFSYGKNPKGSTALCLFETDFLTFINDLFLWWSELGCHYDCYNINGLSWVEFFEVYDNLQPRYVVTPTQNQWVVFFDNNVIGGVHWSVFRNMAERLKIRSVGLLIDDLEIARADNRPFGLQFMYADARHKQTIDRSIALIRDNNKWMFEQYGNPLPFEKTTEYLHKKKADRLTTSLIKDYLFCLGIDSDSDNFIIPEKSLGIKEHIQPRDKIQSETDIKKTITLLKQAMVNEEQEKGHWIVQDGQSGITRIF